MSILTVFMAAGQYSLGTDVAGSPQPQTTVRLLFTLLPAAERVHDAGYNVQRSVAAEGALDQQ